MHPKYLASCFTCVAALIVLTQSHPLDDEVEVEIPVNPLPSEKPKLKQEDTDDSEASTVAPGPGFGSQVAQIISGVATGDLSSILQGSFNFVPDAEVKNSINTAWGQSLLGQIAAVPTTTTTTAAPTTQPSTSTTEIEETEGTTINTLVNTNEEDDDDEEVGEESEVTTIPEDSSVYSRSKVLRVI